MSSINAMMYTTIPSVAFVCNVFLLFTLFTAKKNPAIRAFMLLLTAFVVWTGGSMLMRMQFAPGMEFWWKVSLVGLFLVPYFCFLVAVSYAERRGYLLKVIWGIGFAVVTVMNLFNAFLTAPEVEKVDGVVFVHYTATRLAVIPVVMTILILICAWYAIHRGQKENGMSGGHFVPLMVGVAFMLLGVFLDMVPALNSLPMDTLGCALNAVCVYYAFYRKRIYSLHQMTSSGAMFVVTLLVTALIMPNVMKTAVSVFRIEGFRMTTAAMVVVVILCSAAAIVLFLLLNKLNEGLFVKEQNRREDRVKQYSDFVNSSLQEDDILREFLELAREEIDVEHVYICMYSEDNKRYESVEKLESLEMPIHILKSNPLLEYMESHDGGVMYTDFKKSNLYKSVWENEKWAFDYYEITYVLPFKSEKELMGLALFSKKAGNKSYSFTEISFLESITAVASIALRNACLYTQMEKEAKLDALTDLYNRRTFTKELNQLMEGGGTSPVSIIMFNLDDFSLYNELYGTDEGDRMLHRFAEILSAVFGSKGILARYGGKEFAVLLPFTDAETAQQYAERVKVQLAQRIDADKERTKKFLTFSAGICSYPAVASNANELLTYVNLAIFKIKQTGKNQILIYTRSLEAGSGTTDKRERITEITSTIYALTAAIDAKDHYTFNHSRCVSEYATQLAKAYGLPDDYVEIIRQAGLLHDIGKISIPDAVLTKQGRLTDEEFMIMRQHVERSIEMIRHLPNLDYVIPAVVGHHERYDGKGYPRGISGEDIPIGARCLAVADAFDAMVSKRSYKDKFPMEKALNEIMLNLGTQFDPELGKLFVEKVRAGEIQVIEY